MLDLIGDIETALLSSNLRCALGMALTLPDICGQVEYPTENKVGKRYEDWCEKYLLNQGFHTHIPFTETAPDNKQRVIDPEVCYKLRCAYLHSGNLELNQRESDDYPEFRLQISHVDDEGVYVGSVVKDHYITIDIRHLTKVICNAAREYYNNHIPKEDFESKQIHIIDVASEAKKIEVFGERINDIMNRKSTPTQLTDEAQKLLEDLKNGSVDMGIFTRKNKEISQTEIELMCQFFELLNGGFLSVK